MDLLGQIEPIGRDRATGGYHRFAFTADDAALAEWFAAACQARGFEVTTDRCGNQWAWDRDPDAALAEGRAGVVVGSHLDSVPDGGAFDGPLGVASALAAVDLLQDAGARRDRPLGLVRFVDEEGARFGLACSGSRLLTGAASPDRVLALRDRDGTTYAEALRSARFDPHQVGRDDQTVRRIGSFVELHVEQGRGLAPAPPGEPPGAEVLPGSGSPVGVASRIRPHGRWRVELAGRADHAGTTLLADRDDPMLALAGLVTAVRAAARRHGTLATVGRIDVRPNAVNAIPSAVTAWIDVRADSAEQVRAVLADVDAGLARPAVEESWTGPTELDPELTAIVAAAIAAALPAASPVPVLATGAGHDAGVLAQAGIASSMIFVRNPTGVSHSPAEHAEPADCEAGARALAAAIRRLCGESPRHAE
jgi:beta-ureidopropionase / N-carbamoyl-L-amino-acid hydrolase